MTAHHNKTDDAQDSVSHTMFWFLDDAVGDDASTVQEVDTNGATRLESEQEGISPEAADEEEATYYTRIVNDGELDVELCEQLRKVKVIDPVRASEQYDFKTHGKQKERFIEASFKRKMKAAKREERWKHSYAAVNYMSKQMDRLTENTTLRRVIKDDHWPGYHDHRIRTSKVSTKN